MADLGEIAVKITGDNKEFDKALDDSQKKTEELAKAFIATGGKSQELGEALKKSAADTRTLENAINEAEKSSKKHAEAIKKQAAALQKFGTDMSKFVTLPVLALGAAFVKAAADSEKAESSLKSALKQTGQEVENTTKSMKAFASSLQSTTTFEDDAIISSQALLVRLGNLTEQGLRQVTPAVLDFAQAMGIDLETAASLVGKTIGTSTNALARYGINIDSTLGPTEKLAAVTAQLTDKFGGAAKAAGDTFSGKLAQLKNSAGDLAEEFGGIMLPILSDIISAVKPIIEGFANLDDNTKRTILTMGGIAAAVGPAIKVIGGLNTALKFLAANPILIAIGVFAGLVAGIKAIADAATLTAHEVKAMGDEISAAKHEADLILGPLDKLTDGQKLNADQVIKLVEQYPELTKVIKAGTTSTIEAAEAVRLATLARNNELLAITALRVAQLAQKEENLKGLAQQTAGFLGYGQAQIDAAKAGLKELEKLRGEMTKLSVANTQLLVPIKVQIALQDQREKAQEAATITQVAREQAATKAAEASAEASKKGIITEQEYQDAQFETLKSAKEKYSGMEDVASGFFDFSSERQERDIEEQDKNALKAIGIAQDTADKELDIFAKRQEDLQDIYLEEQALAEESAEKRIDLEEKVKNAAISTAMELFGALKDLSQALLQNQLDAIDARMQAELEAAGVAEDTAIETAEKNLATAQAEGDAQGIIDAQKALKKAQIEEKYRREKAKAEYEAAKFQHGLDIVKAVAQASLAVLQGLATLGPAGAILAGVLGAVQVASVIASEPKPPAFAQGGIVMPQAGGMLANVAEAGQPEVIFPLDKLNSFLNSSSMNGGKGESSMMHITVQLDSKPILDKIFPATRNGRVLIDARAVV